MPQIKSRSIRYRKGTLCHYFFNTLIQIKPFAAISTLSRVEFILRIWNHDITYL